MHHHHNADAVRLVYIDFLVFRPLNVSAASPRPGGWGLGLGECTELHASRARRVHAPGIQCISGIAVHASWHAPRAIRMRMRAMPGIAERCCYVGTTRVCIQSEHSAGTARAAKNQARSHALARAATVLEDIDRVFSGGQLGIA